MATKLILIGGFLGAGKTTLMTRAAKKLRERGLKVGLVTNDQGDGLVDTAYAKKMDLEVTEVTGGCFCCNFPDLMKSIEALEEKVSPDVILAEPVGSCTDLMATILRPLSLHHGDRFDLAPLSILVDPLREFSDFDESVAYLYDRQLAEADLILSTKSDKAGDTGATGEALAQLKERYPGSEVMQISSVSDEGVDRWLEIVLNTTTRADKSLEIDYGLYGKAEATLGWLNIKGNLKGEEPFAPTAWVVQFFSALEETLGRQHAGIAHLKAYLSPPEKPEAAIKASLTRNGEALGWDIWNKERVKETTFILNARVNMAPDNLEMLVRMILESASMTVDVTHEIQELECFSPAPPTPTHRIQVGS